MARNYFSIYIVLLFLGLQCLWLPVASATEGTVFKITRLQIYFDNQRAEIVVPQNHTPFKAYVELQFEGAGLLQGSWELDGQFFAHVRHHLDNGKGGTITFTIPQTPELPTWRTGSHRLRFVLSNPDLAQTEPEALYFVMARQVATETITLSFPAHLVTLSMLPHTFRWASSQENAGYLLIFYDEQKNTIFSAYTNKLQYTLPASTLGKVFTAGQHYFWKVDGYDGNLNKTASSTRQPFFFMAE